MTSTIELTYQEQKIADMAARHLLEKFNLEKEIKALTEDKLDFAKWVTKFGWRHEGNKWVNMYTGVKIFTDDGILEKFRMGR